MIEISKCKERCFASISDGCAILTKMPIKCSPDCAFYKPQGCEDWIRQEKDGIWLIPPEEYYKGR